MKLETLGICELHEEDMNRADRCLHFIVFSFESGRL